MIESVANVSIGYVTAIATQLIIFPVFGIDIDLGTNLSIGLVFTAVALIRSYIIRRWFNGMVHRAAMKLGDKL